MKKVLTILILYLLSINAYATFTVIQNGDPGDADILMQNFRHVNYGSALLPVDATGIGVNNTIDLGSISNYFRNGFITTANITNFNTSTINFNNTSISSSTNVSAVDVSGNIFNFVGKNVTGNSPEIRLSSTSTIAYTTPKVSIYGYAPTSATYLGQIDFRRYNNSKLAANIASSLATDSTSTGNITLYTYNPSTEAVLGYFSLSGGILVTNMIYNNTSGSAANMYVDSNGIIYRSTSSARYKQNIRDIELDTSKIYSLKPRTFQMKSNPNKNVSYLIAEETDKILPEAVQHSVDGIPDGIDNNTLIICLINEIKKLNYRTKILEAKIK